jgi:uncharacterized protein (TIGR02452 family)
MAGFASIAPGAAVPSVDPANARRRAIAASTVGALDRRGYTAPSGRWVSLETALASAGHGAVAYRRDDPVPAPRPGAVATRVEVTGETSIGAARRLALADGPVPLVLVFASHRNPGGGFLNGAEAQEEAVCRCSGLYDALRRQPVYRAVEEHPLGNAWVIHVPRVAVFRDETGEAAWLEAPWHASMIVAPAVSAAWMRDRGLDPALSEPEMRWRIDRVLAVARAHGEGRLVLGAWGCGVFRQDPAMVGRAFGEALQGTFRGAFEEVVFAVHDRRRGRPVLGPFRAALEGAWRRSAG